MEFYKCKHCGNLVLMMHKSGVPMICCGQEMELLTENTTDGAVEKHVPVVAAENNTVHINVGSVAHPMIEAHYIQWIALETTDGTQIKYLQPNEEPKADFLLTENEQMLKVYEYCNLHGLWSATL
ncbi:MAG: desulfoferrodoxin [Alphaproteobacteria bacterium]|nr:desulfoferrodoxin [Alphaproteobacteria bacterium]